MRLAFLSLIKTACWLTVLRHYFMLLTKAITLWVKTDRGWGLPILFSQSFRIKLSTELSTGGKSNLLHQTRAGLIFNKTSIDRFSFELPYQLPGTRSAVLRISEKSSSRYKTDAIVLTELTERIIAGQYLAVFQQKRNRGEAGSNPAIQLLQLGDTGCSPLLEFAISPESVAINVVGTYHAIFHAVPCMGIGNRLPSSSIEWISIPLRGQSLCPYIQMRISSGSSPFQPPLSG